MTFVFATKFKLTLSLLQIVNVSVFSKESGGFTITVMVCAAPMQFPKIDVGNTEYITTWFKVELLIKTSPITLFVFVINDSPVTLGLLMVTNH